MAPVHAEGLVQKVPDLQGAQAKWDGGAHLVQLWGHQPSGVSRLERNRLTCAFFQQEGKLKDRIGGTGMDDVHILFVEDDEAIAQMYKLKLELDGYHVDVAPDGQVALQMARSSLPDIIFLDIRLPKLDGLDVLEALRADPKTQRVPVVILSSHSEKELVERGAKLGALDHLIKSKTTPAKLADSLDGWLRE
jgi:CheY-like chemotaxis protein